MAKATRMMLVPATVLALAGCEINIERPPPPGASWPVVIGGGLDDQAVHVEVDGQDNIYVTGTFKCSAAFGSTTLTASGGGDAFLVKLNRTGSVKWVYSCGSSFHQGTKYGFQDLAVDGAGNSYLASWVSGIAKIPTKDGKVMEINSAAADLLLLKVDSGGRVSWVKTVKSQGTDTAQRVAVDGSGAVTIYGTYSNTIKFGELLSLNTTSSEQGFLARLDQNTGKYTMAVDFGPPALAVSDMAVDESGNSYIVGNFKSSSLKLGTFTLDHSQKSSSGELYNDIFWAKLDKKGQVVAAVKAGDVHEEFVKSFVVDRDGTSYLTGLFKTSTRFGSITLGGKFADLFVAAFKDNGEELWAIKGGGTGWDVGEGIALAGTGKLAVGGRYTGEATFGNLPPVEEACCEKSGNVGDALFLQVRYDNSKKTASFSKVDRAGGIQFDYGLSVAVDSLGRAFVVGKFNGTATFGRTSPVQVTSSGMCDAYVWKIE